MSIFNQDVFLFLTGLIISSWVAIEDRFFNLVGGSQFVNTRRNRSEARYGGVRVSRLFSDRGTAVSNAIIPISRNLWSHQSLWQPCRPPTSALVCKASLEKLNLCFFPFTPRYLGLQLGAPAPDSIKVLWYIFTPYSTKLLEYKYSPHVARCYGAGAPIYTTLLDL